MQGGIKKQSKPLTTEQFQYFILPLKHKMFRFAMSYMHEQADAKDIVQEVMLSAWEQIKDPFSVKNLEAWCMTATRNRALNMLKKKGRNYEELEEQTDLKSKEASPLKSTEEKEAIGRVRQIIASLPQKQQQVIRLRDMEGFSYNEIAEILDIELNHVKVLLFRARKRVKEQLSHVLI